MKYIYRKLFKHCYKFWKIKYKFFILCTFGEKRCGYNIQQLFVKYSHFEIINILLKIANIFVIIMVIIMVKKVSHISLIFSLNKVINLVTILVVTFEANWNKKQNRDFKRNVQYKMHAVCRRNIKQIKQYSKWVRFFELINYSEHFIECLK